MAETCIRCGEARTKMRDTIAGLVCPRCTGELRRKEILGERDVVARSFSNVAAARLEEARAGYDDAMNRGSSMDETAAMLHLERRRLADERRARFRAEVRDCPDCFLKVQESANPPAVIVTLRSGGFGLRRTIYKSELAANANAIKEAIGKLRYEQRICQPCRCGGTGKVNGLGDRIDSLVVDLCDPVALQKGAVVAYDDLGFLSPRQSFAVSADNGGIYESTPGGWLPWRDVVGPRAPAPRAPGSSPASS